MASAHIPGPTYCLLIGAAKRSLGLQREHQERPFDATLNDLIKMVNWCASFNYRRPSTGRWQYPIHVGFLVNDLGLLPSATMLTDKGKRTMDRTSDVTIFRNKVEFNDVVEKSIGHTAHTNVIIFFSGHGALTAPSGEHAGYSNFPPDKIALGKLMHHVLVIPQSIGLPKESYTDEELTRAVVSGLKRRPDRNVYLVLHACNSGGMFRGWQLETALRKEDGLSIALFASAASDSTSQWNSDDGDSGYVSIFAKFARPGLKLHTIQKNIFTQSLAEAPGHRQPGHSPCLVTIRPSMAAMTFLPE